MSSDKFLQPTDAIVITKPGSGLLSSDEVIANAKARIAAGANADDVAAELVERELHLHQELTNDE